MVIFIFCLFVNLLPSLSPTSSDLDRWAIEKMFLVDLNEVYESGSISKEAYEEAKKEGLGRFKEEPERNELKRFSILSPLFKRTCKDIFVMECKSFALGFFLRSKKVARQHISKVWINGVAMRVGAECFYETLFKSRGRSGGGEEFVLFLNFFHKQYNVVHIGFMRDGFFCDKRGYEGNFFKIFWSTNSMG